MATKTFNWTNWNTTNAWENLADAGNSAQITYARDATDAAAKFTETTKNTTTTEYARKSGTGDTWASIFGIDPTNPVSQVRITTWKKKVVTNTKLTSHTITFKLINDSAGTVATMISASAMATGTDASYVTMGATSASAIGAAYTSGSTPVRLSLEYSIVVANSSGNSAIDTRFDDVTLEITYALTFRSTVNNATQAQSSSKPTLTAHNIYTLTLASLTQAQASEEIALKQNYRLTVQNCQQVQSASKPFLTTPPTTSLGTPNDGYQTSASTIDLKFTGIDSAGLRLDYEVQVDTSSTFSSGSINLSLEYTSLPGIARTNATLSKPTNTVDGDFLLAAIYIESSSNTVTPPEDWSTIIDTTANDSSFRLILYYKRASGEGDNWTWTYNNTFSAGFVKRFSGIIQSGNPEDCTRSVNTGTGTSPSWTEITTNTNNAAILGIEGHFATVSRRTLSTLTELIDEDDLFIQGDLKTPPGATGALTATDSSTGQWITILLALKPTTIVDAFSTDHTGFSAGENHPTDSGVEQTYTTQTPLSPNTYYWRVRATNTTSDGTYSGWGGWSGSKSFEILGAAPLTVQSSIQPQTSENITLTAYIPNFTLTVQNTSHAQTSGNTVLTQNFGYLTVGNNTQSQASTSVSLIQNYLIAVQSAQQNQISENTVLIQNYVLSINNSSQTHSSESISLTQNYSLKIKKVILDSIVNIDHETGSISEWTGYTGPLSVVREAGLCGTEYGLKAESAGTCYVHKSFYTPPITSPQIRIRFYFNPINLTEGDGTNTPRLAEVHSNVSTTPIGVVLRLNGGKVYIYLQAGQDDSKPNLNTSEYEITKEEHYVEFLLTRASDTESSNGYLDVRLDGNYIRSIANIDNYVQMTNYMSFEAGCFYGDPGAGYVYIDEYIVNTTGHPLGPVSLGSLHAQTSDNITLTQNYRLSINSTEQLQTSDNLSITYNSGTVTLTVQNTTQLQSSDNISLIQNYSLTIWDSAQLQTSDNVSLTQTFFLTVQNTTQAQNIGIYQIFWEDGFDRADGPVGNNWNVYSGAGATISGSMLHWATSGYGQLYNQAGGNLPADYDITFYIPAAWNRAGEWWGVFARASTPSTSQVPGLNFFHWSGASLTTNRVHSTVWYDGTLLDVTITDGYPSSWSDTGIDHTVKFSIVGTGAEIFLDGQSYGTVTGVPNNNTTGTYVGFNGDHTDTNPLCDGILIDSRADLTLIYTPPAVLTVQNSIQLQNTNNYIFQDGQGGDVDTAYDSYFSLDDHDSVNGNRQELFARKFTATLGSYEAYISCFKFTLSSLVGKTINSATLYLYKNGTDSWWGTGRTFVFHRILAANADWVETEASWDYKKVSGYWEGDTGHDGGADGGGNQSDIDYSSTVLGTFNVPDNWDDGTGSEASCSLDTTEFINVINGSNSINLTQNLGNGGLWCSSDHVTTAYHPKLVVYYVTPLDLTQHAPQLSVYNAIHAQFANYKSFVDGYEGDVSTYQDDYIQGSGQTEYNNGVNENYSVWQGGVGLIRFILQSFPSGVDVSSAILTFYISAPISNNHTVYFYEISDANGDWIEGTKSSAIAGAGEPCWEAKEADGSGGVTTLWAGSPGLSTADTDYKTPAIGTVNWATSYAQYESINISLDADTVKAWCGQSTNNGIKFILDSTEWNNGALYYSDSLNTGYRPKLTVYYTAPLTLTGHEPELIVQDSIQSHTSENINLTFYPPSGTLTVQNVSQAQYSLEKGNTRLNNVALIDDFNRATLGSNWHTGTWFGDNLLTIHNNIEVGNPPASSWSGGYYNVTTFGPDISVAVDVTGDDVYTGGHSLYARLNSSDSPNGYRVRVGLILARLTRLDDGVETTISTGSETSLSRNLAPGDKIALEIIGNNIVGWVYQDGSWGSYATAVDNTYPDAGYLGYEVGTDGNYGDNFRGENLNRNVKLTQNYSLSVNNAAQTQTLNNYKFVDGYGGDIETYVDTCLRKDQPTTNFGSGNDIAVGAYDAASIAHGLIKFNLSSLSSGYICSSGTLTLTLYYIDGTRYDVNIYQLATENNGWTSAGATWNHAVEDTIEWAGSAGASTAGTDYINTVIGTFTPPASIDTTFDISISASALGNLFGSSFTFFLKSTDEVNKNDLSYYQSNAFITSYRPKLTVYYKDPTNLTQHYSLSINNATQQHKTGFLNTFTDGYGGDVTTYKDNSFCNTVPNENNGAGTVLAMGMFVTSSYLYRSILQFSLSSISVSSTCDSATLYIYNVASSWQNMACEVKFYSILSANSGWNEGTHNEAPATSGESCWNYKSYDTIGWAGSEGLGSSGTDYNATAIGTQVCGDDVEGTEYQVSLTPSVVKDWFGSDDNNFGILARATTENVQGNCVSIASSDHATTAYRPKLVVVYISNDPFPLTQNYSLSVNNSTQSQNTNNYRFQDGQGGDVDTNYDTRVYGGSPDENLGNSTNLTVQHNTNNTYTHKPLIKFDLSSISSTSLCSSATLYLYRTDAGGGTTNTIVIWSISSGNGDWTETGATWNKKDGINNWAGSVGLETDGTDYESTSIGSFSSTNNSAVGTEYICELTPSRIKNWFGESNTNYGILICGTENFDGANHFFASSDHATEAYRPKLVVLYEIPLNLTQNYGLSVNNSTQSQTSDNINLIFYPPTGTLGVQNSSHTITSVSVSLTQHYNLSVNNSIQTQTSSNANLSAHYSLSVNNAVQTQTSSKPTLSSHYSLTVNNASQTQTVSKPTLSAHYSLAINNAVQTQTSDKVTLAQHYALLVQDATQLQTSDNIVLTQHYSLAVNSVTQVQTSGNIVLTQHQVLVVQNTTQSQTTNNYRFVDGFGGDVQTYYDTYLNSNFPSTSYGQSDQLGVHPNELSYLLKFDLSSIPLGSTCVSADLTLYIAVFAMFSVTVNYHILASGNRTWSENYATWNHQIENTLTDWIGSVGAETSGTDYIAAVLGSFASRSNSVIGDAHTASLTPTVVDDYFGGEIHIIAKAAATPFYIYQYSSRCTTTGYRPKLVVVYEVPLNLNQHYSLSVNNASQTQTGSNVTTTQHYSLSVNNAFQFHRSDYKWWLPDGTSISDVIAVYSPERAASYLLSKVNLNVPGTYELSPIASVPTWDNMNGWTFDGTNPLTGGITTASSSWSFVVKFSDWGSDTGATPLVGYSADSGFAMQPHRYGAVLAMNGNFVYEDSVFLGGVYAIAGKNTYRDGASKATIPADSSPEYGDFQIGGGICKIQSIGIYNKTLTPNQVYDITLGMNNNGLAPLKQHQVLSINNALQTQTSSKPSLSAHYSLTVNNASQTQTSSKPALSAHYSITVNNATQLQTSTNVSLTQHQILAINSASQGHTASTITLTAYAPPCSLLLDDSGQPLYDDAGQFLLDDTSCGELLPRNTTLAQSATNVSLTQHQVLGVNNSTQYITSDKISLLSHYSISVNSVAQTQTATSVTLSTHYSLTVNNASHTQTSTSPSLSAHYSLTINNAIQAEIVSSPILLAHYSLTLNSSVQLETSDNIILSPHNIYSLSVNNTVQSQTASTVALGQHQYGVLFVYNAGQSQTAGSIVLTQHQILTIQNASQTQTATKVSLLSHYSIAVNNASQTQTATKVTLSSHYALTVNNCLHVQTSGNIALSAHYSLVIENASQIQTAAKVSLTAHYGLSIGSSTHTQTVTNVILLAHYSLTVNNTSHAQTAGNVVLSSGYTLIINNTNHAITSNYVSLIQHQILLIGNAGQLHTAGNVVLIQHQYGALFINSAVQAQIASNIDLVQHQRLQISDAQQTITSSNISITSRYSLSIANAYHTITSNMLALAQHYFFSLTVSNTTHTQTSSKPSLVQHHALGIQNANQLHYSTTIGLYGRCSIAVQNSEHLQSSEYIVLQARYTLSINGCTHVQSSTSISLVQHQSLIVQNAIQGIYSDIILLIQHYVLVINNVSQLQTSENVELSQYAPRAIADNATHIITSDTITLNQKFYLGPDNCSHTHAADGDLNIIFHGEQFTLEVQNCVHTQTAQGVNLFTPVVIPMTSFIIRSLQGTSIFNRSLTGNSYILRSIEGKSILNVSVDRTSYV